MPEKEISKASWLARWWWRMSLRSRGVAVMTIPVALLLLALFAIFWAEGNVQGAEEAAARAFDVRSELAQLRGLLDRAEESRAGYLAARPPRSHSSYQEARSAVEASLNRLSVLLETDPSHAGIHRPPAVAGVAGMVRDQLHRLDALPADSSGEASAMAALQSKLEEIAGEQERAFSDARLVRDVARRRVFRVLILCGILGPLSALLIHLIVSGRLVGRIRRVEENARRLAQSLPLEPFPPASDEIATLAGQLEHAALLLHAREQELRASENRYRELFNHSPIPYEETDRAGIVRRFNQAVCTLLKARPEQIAGHGAWEFVSPDQQEAVRSGILERIELGVETGPFECDYMLGDGTRIAVEVRENLMRKENGETVGMVRSLLDVTERNLAAIAARKVEQYAMELRNKNEQLGRALDAARSATEAKSRFLASVSHELRTPLNGIIGFSELMHDGRLGPVSTDQADVLGDILTSARHLLQLINDILDLSKVEAGKMEFRPEEVRIAQLANEVRDVVRPLADRKRLNLSVETQPQLVACLDAARFKQVLYNYLSNAVKFTPENGAVYLRIIRHDDAFFTVEVEDTGIGIAAEEISRLFQEFQQLPNSRKAEQGTGLGLALTRHIVEAQGGSVSVRSIPGKGSIFSAVLPLRPGVNSAAHTI